VTPVVGKIVHIPALVAFTGTDKLVEANDPGDQRADIYDTSLRAP